MNNVIFMTTIFPMPKIFLYDFLDSLSRQTLKNFDILVLNDGYENFLEIKEKYSNLNIIVLDVSNTIAKNREIGINYAIENSYEYLIFGDSDDYFSSNRVELSISLLEKYDIVVNDFTSFNENKILEERYLSNRIKNNQVVNIDYILDRNIFGLSNTSINLSKIKKVNFDKDLIVVDWYLFSLLLIDNLSAVFTNKTLTFYRQHENNIIGINKEKKINSILRVKKKHYSLLKNISDKYNNLYDNIIYLEKAINTNKFSQLKFEKLDFPLWWEETKLQ